MRNLKNYSSGVVRKSFVYKKRKGGLGARHLQGLLLFLLLFVTAISEGSIMISLMFLREEKSFMTELTSYHVGWLLSAFYISAILPSILAGYLSAKANNKFLLLTFSIVNTFLTYITPVMMKTYRWKAFIVIRLVQGMVYGLVRPSTYNILVRWFPPSGLYRNAPVVLSGIYLGLSFLCTISPQTAAGSGGWESVFYFSGNCGLVWTIAFAGLGAQDPNSCWYISNEEKTLIDGVSGFRGKGTYRKNVPFKKISRCLPLYAATVSHGVQYLGLESSFDTVQRFLKRNSLTVIEAGIVTAVPFFINVFAVALLAFITNYFTQKGVLTIKTLRFTANSIGLCGMGSCFILASSTESLTYFLIFYYLGYILNSFVHFGFYINFIDLSPNYVGMLYGWAAGFVHIFSLIGLLISSYLMEEYDADVGWRAVFSITGIVLILGNLFFTMFGSVQVQSLNVIVEEEEEEEL